MTNWLQNFAEKTPLHWWLFAGAGTLVALIALLTVSFQSIRAALANPVSSLRSD
jgi:putative ABC transport system permease protein